MKYVNIEVASDLVSIRGIWQDKQTNTEKRKLSYNKPLSCRCCYTDNHYCSRSQNLLQHFIVLRLVNIITQFLQKSVLHYTTLTINSPKVIESQYFTV